MSSAARHGALAAAPTLVAAALVVAGILVSQGGPPPAGVAGERFKAPSRSAGPDSAGPGRGDPLVAPAAAAAPRPARLAPSASEVASSGPVIEAISPAAGSAGETVTLTGQGLFSEDRLITVLFGSAEAPVWCPSQEACDVMVPSVPGGAATVVAVTISTSAGTSNSVAFTYL